MDLQPIDFAAYARACGAGGFTVDDPENVESVLREAFAHPGPALVQAVVDPNEPALPGHITMKQALALRRVADPRREVPHSDHQGRASKQSIREVV